MTITYVVGKSLYVNVTNKCTNMCLFCVRNHYDSVNGKDVLWLEREPTKEEILEDILTYRLSDYKDLCFCGFGEPTYRIHDILWVTKKLKEKRNIIIRLNTNGHANKINKEDVTPLFAGHIDVVSISLNQKNAEEYDKLCKSKYGPSAFDETIDFTKKVKQYVPRVILSVVDIIKPDDIEACRKIAADLGVEFRVREMIQD
jgi:TatD family-associated radical SAM protein